MRQRKYFRDYMKYPNLFLSGLNKNVSIGDIYYFTNNILNTPLPKDFHYDKWTVHMLGLNFGLKHIKSKRMRKKIIVHRNELIKTFLNRKETI